MKNNFPHIGLAKLCGWFGITRQAYYENSWTGIDISIEEDLVLKEVLAIRKNHSRIGVRKLQTMLQPFLMEHHIKLGRDGLFDLLAANCMLVKRKKRRVQTTWSQHWLRKYPNLIRDFVPTGPNQLWVSDITYWKVKDHNFYITFITDAYSHKIVGYQIAETLESIESVKALEMALKSLKGREYKLIHHSDRGVQYCSSDYVKQLQEYEIKISMTEKGDPLENAVAERINGIIKEEYLFTYDIKSLNQAPGMLRRAVELYNNERPHMSISNLTPEVVHSANHSLKIERLWKNYYKKNDILVKPFQD